MEYNNKNLFNIEWNYGSIILFLFLLSLPNMLGIINLDTAFGFKIHFFQIAIFLAAFIYGPTGGLLSGIVGSIYSAFIMHNPYLVIGNAILGFFAGLFYRYKPNAILSVILAFLIQLPWLIITDYYLVNLPATFILGVIISLAISNLIWAVIVKYNIKPIRDYLKC